MENFSGLIIYDLKKIQYIFKKSPSASTLKELNNFDFVGIVALIHDFYNEIENVIKQINFIVRKVSLQSYLNLI